MLAHVRLDFCCAWGDEMIGTPKEPGTPSRGKADYSLGWGSFWVYDSWVGRLGLQYAVTRDLSLWVTFQEADFSGRIPSNYRTS
jgi:hypothetical protein